MSGFETIEEAKARLGEAGYLADESAALVCFLAGRLGKPVLVEGPAGVGKTEPVSYTHLTLPTTPYV